jgi:uncharacterized protein (TIGR03437 family)
MNSFGLLWALPLKVRTNLDHGGIIVTWLTFCRMLLVSAAVLNGQVSVLTWHNDNARTGQNLQETALTPANVNSATFGRLATLNVDGKVDAQPLYVPAMTIPGQGVHDVLYVATEHGSLYAFDADNFAQLQKVSLLGLNETPSDDHGCSQVTPEIGITATPAIDLQSGPHGMIYVIAQSKDSSQHYHHRLHALDLPTLTEQLGGPVEIQASFPGNGAENIFNPTVHTERPGLLISKGAVYTSWGSHCDAGSYAGWVLSYNESTLGQVGVLNLIPNGNDGGIWAAGSGPAADSNGNVFLLTGNGTFDTTLNSSSFPSKGDFGNAFVKISTSEALSVADYFTMINTVSESNGDVDLGSGGLILLPPLDNGHGTLVSLVVGAGKDGNIYVLDQTNLGKFNPRMDSIYQLMSGILHSGTWSSPAWFNGNLYYGGVSDNLKAFAFTGGSFSLASHSATTFPFPGTTPSISANGTSNAIIWAVENQGTAVLHAYNANNLATELYNSNQAAGGRDQFGIGNKYIVPTIANGKVFVGTTSGVGVFGLLAGNPNVPAISPGGIVPLDSTSSSIQPGSWVSIYGTNLITGSIPQNWSGQYPISLGGTSVTIDNKSAYLSYAAPTLINLQAPDDNTRGPVNVTVTNANGSATATVTLADQSPSFSLLGDAIHVAGIIVRPDGSGAYGLGANSYDILGPTGTSLGYRTVAAKAGDTVVLFGIGFGPTNPPVSAGQTYSGGPAQMTDSLSMTINGKPVTPFFAGVGVPGLFQFNLTIPAGLGTGDQPLLAKVNGVSTQSGVLISLQ